MISIKGTYNDIEVTITASKNSCKLVKCYDKHSVIFTPIKAEYNIRDIQWVDIDEAEYNRVNNILLGNNISRVEMPSIPKNPLDEIKTLGSK